MNKSFKLLYPNFKPKACTFSYDDGVLQDSCVIEIFNKFGLKGTFNLNSGQSGETKFRKGYDCSHLDLSNNIYLYKGHEIATHTFSHPHMETLTMNEQFNEYSKDIENLSDLYNQKIIGSAYPYGTYSNTTLKVLEKNGIKYSRTTRSTYNFRRPYNFLLWHPTIHHNDERLSAVVNEFYQTEEELAILYIWGHSYEFALQQNLDSFESTCEELSKHSDIWFATNGDIYEYIKAAELAYVRNDYLINPSDRKVYFEINKIVVCLNPHQSKFIGVTK